MHLLKNILNNKWKSSLALFTIAFLFRIISLIAFDNLYYLTPDGIGYHNMAVNLVKGNGLSGHINPPYYPTFFREPGYPVFLATGYKIWNVFGGELHLINLKDPNEWNNVERQAAIIYKEIVFAKFYQAFFDSFSVVILFLILCYVLPAKVAFLISLCYGLFWPVAIHCNYILRESFQTLILLLMNFFLVKGLFTRKYLYYIPFAFLWALSNITFQITMALVPFIFALIWYFKKSIIKALIETGALTLLMIIFVLPWLFHVYSYYPDIRIAKTCGTALTYDYMNYALTLQKAEKLGLISKDEKLIIRRETLSFANSTEYFKRSFNGYFQAHVDSINALLRNKIPKKSFMEDFVYEIKNIAKLYGLNFWVKKKVGFKKSVEENLNEKNIIPILVYSFLILFGLLSFSGFILYYKNFLPVLLVFAFIWALSYFIGAEPRRFLPAYPYVFSFGVMGVIWVLSKLKLIKVDVINNMKMRYQYSK